MVALIPIPIRVVEEQFCTTVPSPAHDSMSALERRLYLDACPDSYFAVTRSLDDLPDDVDMTVLELLQLGRDSLDRLLDKGAFSPLRAPAMYVYRLDDGNHSQVGVLCGAETAAFGEGSIRAHERVFGAQRDHLARHFEIVATQSSPIVMAHAESPEIDQIVAEAVRTEPLLDFVVPDGLHQTLWALSIDAGERIVALLADEPLYIIDGHHRTGAADTFLVETGLPAAEHMLAAVFPAGQMRSLAFHRWIRSEDDCGWLFRGIEEHLGLRHLAGAESDEIDPDELVIYHEHQWSAVKLPSLPDGDALSALDPVRLQRHLLGPLVGIDESAPRSRLDYLAGDRSPDELSSIIDVSGGALVLMRPVEMDELFAVADASQIMPPKSTYFMPKARSGVVLRPL